MTDFDPERTAVVVVDMQNGFCDPEGSLYAPPSRDAIESVSKVIEFAEANNIPTIYTKDVHPLEQFDNNDHYNEFDRWGEHVVEDSWETEIVDELPAEDADHIVTKHTYDAFYQTDLEGWLETHNIDTLVFCGTLANVCVLHSARSAALRDNRTLIVEDALGYIEEDDREMAVEHAEWLFGETITTSDL